MLTANFQQFNAALQAHAARTPAEAVRFHRRIALEALRRVVMKTPVDTGRARGNWQLTIGAPAKGEVARVDKGGGGTIAEGLNALATLPPYSVVWLTNNVAYIEALEHGHSQQAPAGMLAVTLAELHAIVQAAQLGGGGFGGIGGPFAPGGAP